MGALEREAYEIDEEAICTEEDQRCDERIDEYRLRLLHSLVVSCRCDIVV